MKPAQDLAPAPRAAGDRLGALSVGLDKLLAFYCSLAAIGLWASGRASFELWIQVVILRYADPVDLIINRHPWALRSALIWPLYQVADFLSVDPDAAFSFVALICVLYLMRVTASMAMSFVGATRFVRTKAAIYWLAFYAFLLDGRLVLALAGLAMLLSTHLHCLRTGRFGLTGWLRALIALFLTSVGTGSFAVGSVVFTLLLSEAPTRRPDRARGRLRWGVAAAAGVYYLISPNIQRTAQSIDDGWAGALEHGIGRTLLPVVIIGLPVAIMMSPTLVRAADARWLQLRTCAICAAAGLFGLSGLAMGTVPFGVLFAAGLQHALPHPRQLRSETRASVQRPVTGDPARRPEA